MQNLTADEFIKFLNSFKDEYFFSITEISRAKTGNERSLITNDFKMYSLDDMCKKYEIIKNNLPKTMDAIHFQINDDKASLYLIEFKNFNMKGSYSTYSQFEALYSKLLEKNEKTIDEDSDEKIVSDDFLKRFEYVKNHFIDSIEFDLRMKPLETILVSLPWLYDEYCKNNPEIIKKDFDKFLRSIDIHLIVFIHRYAPYINVSANRLSAHKIDNALKNQYNRLCLAGVIADDNVRILSSDMFDYFIKKEKLHEC